MKIYLMLLKKRNKEERQKKEKKIKQIEKSPTSEGYNKEIDRDDHNEDEEQDDETKSINKNNPKPYLKRKTRAIKFHKVDWKNVKGRIDCWSKPSARSVNREKSNPPPSRKPINKNKQEEKPRLKNKKMNNIQSRIDTGIRRIKQNQFGSEESNENSFEAANQYNLGEYADEENPQIEQNFADGYPKFHQEIVEPKRFNFKKNNIDPQYTNNPYLDNYHYENEYHLQDEGEQNYEEVANQYQEFTPPGPKENVYQSPYDNENDEVEIEMERDKIPTLKIDQLESLYTEIHPNPVDLDSRPKLNPHSILPQIHIDYYSQILNSPQMISEEIYDIILEELRNQYERLCS